MILLGPAILLCVVVVAHSRTRNRLESMYHHYEAFLMSLAWVNVCDIVGLISEVGSVICNVVQSIVYEVLERYQS